MRQLNRGHIKELTYEIALELYVKGVDNRFSELLQAAREILIDRNLNYMIPQMEIDGKKIARGQSVGQSKTI